VPKLRIIFGQIIFRLQTLVSGHYISDYSSDVLAPRAAAWLARPFSAVHAFPNIPTSFARCFQYPSCYTRVHMLTVYSTVVTIPTTFKCILS
jgi:hypothetical protein